MVCFVYKGEGFNSSNVAQQSVHWTAGIRRRFQAFFWLRVFSAPKQSPHPPRPPAKQAVGQYNKPKGGT